jgi:hypothetical protein
MSATEAAIERHPIETFMQSVARWDIPSQGAWVCAIALRTPRGTDELIALRVGLLAPGLSAPEAPNGMFVDSARHGVHGVAGVLDAQQTASLLTELRSERVDTLAPLIGRKVALPDANKNPPRPWNTDALRERDGLPGVMVRRWIGTEVGETFGRDCIERAKHALMGGTPPFESLGAVVKRLGFWWTHSFEQPHDHPALDITAQLPAKIAAFDYDKRRWGYRITLANGRGVPREKMGLSLVSGLQHTFTISDGSRQPGAGAGWEHWEYFHPGRRLDEPVGAVLLYDAEHIASASCSGAQEAQYDFQSPRAEEPWAVELHRTFDVTRLSLKRTLGRILPIRARDVVLRRVQDAVEMYDQRPFYSILAAGSVVEALLKVRLKRIGKAKLAAQCAKRGTKAPGGPLSKLRLVDAINATEAAGLLEGLDVKGFHSLREARNAVHIELTKLRRHEFTRAEAISAISALVGLASQLDRRG